MGVAVLRFLQHAARFIQIVRLLVTKPDQSFRRAPIDSLQFLVGFPGRTPRDYRLLASKSIRVSRSISGSPRMGAD
jgi:hypothetical protein